jgi:hypothetical protein
MVALKRASLLALCRRAALRAGVTRYCEMVSACQVEMTGDLAHRPVLGPTNFGAGKKSAPD